MKQTMEAWLKYPSSTIVVDFECMVGPGFPLLLIQVAIANAHGDWVVPTTPINHRISKREPLERGNKLGPLQRTMWERMVMKFNGADNRDETTEGLTWKEIASIIDDYIQMNGELKTFVAWSALPTDYNCLRNSLSTSSQMRLLTRAGSHYSLFDFPHRRQGAP
ncbi:uncharacterized protein BP5553_09172 [Venustampulla echinocandica]|uniref:Uncharacterized protein n=1 Tax=Venustampulla echinocandica TaxID=2656787 RepID=A0A370TBZ1_9HELO|nr:uncharacterized protein BP5553_09172 [Venustampulla echinocandica]RDL31770.1 hypothetical protein BP5553_09172 [Venustampulla echinocandica]